MCEFDSDSGSESPIIRPLASHLVEELLGLALKFAPLQNMHDGAGSSSRLDRSAPARNKPASYSKSANELRIAEDSSLWALEACRAPTQHCSNL